MFADDLSRIEPVEFAHEDGGKPSTWSVSDLDEALSFAARTDMPESDIVAVPRSLMTQLLAPEDQTTSTGLAVLRVVDFRALVSQRVTCPPEGSGQKAVDH
jgi:hypothetical protein